MAQLTVPIAFDHDDLQRMVDEKIAEVKAQFIPKDQYEQRLKADLKAILVQLQLEIEEQRQDNPEFNIWKDGYNTANDIDYVIIQQKINELGGKTDVSKEK